MPVIRIDRFDDPRLADYRNVSDAELLRRRNCSSPKDGWSSAVCSRADTLWYRCSSTTRRSRAWRRDSRGSAQTCRSTSATRGASRRSSGSTCTADASRWRGGRPARTLADHEQRRRLILVLEGVTDADNVGSAFRNAAAFGASGVLSDACCDPLYRKAMRTSMGQRVAMPYARLRRLAERSAALKARRVHGRGADARADAMELHRCRPAQQTERMALLVGSEGPGLSSEAERSPTCACEFRCSRDVDSLNLATRRPASRFITFAVIP